MAKLRIVQVDIEADAGGFSELLRGVLGGGQLAAPPAASVEHAPAALPAASAPEKPTAAVDAHPPVKPVVSRPAAAKSRKPQSAPADGSTAAERILAALKKRPLSSLELAEALGTEPKQIYSPCSILKSKGLIVSKEDETDGTRRYFLA